MKPDANPPTRAASVRPRASALRPSAGPRELHSVRQTGCCVVGAGPAGAMLALLLARPAVPVTLLDRRLKRGWWTASKGYAAAKDCSVTTSIACLPNPAMTFRAAGSRILWPT